MTDVSFFFRGWGPVVRIFVVRVTMYAALVTLLRLSGSRTIASMTVFDFVVTVAIGSVFARALTATDVALMEAVLAFVLLIVLQYTLGRIHVRWPSIQRIVTNPPTLLYFREEFLRGAMREQRVTEQELRAAVRKQNVGSMAEVEAVILESTGEVSVLTELSDLSVFGNVLRNQIPTQVCENDD